MARKFVSLDIETTGTDPRVHQILEVGAVVLDLTNKDMPMPRFSRLLRHDHIVGEPYILARNCNMLMEFATYAPGREFCTVEKLSQELHAFLVSCRLPVNGRNQVEVQLIGHNVQGFTLPFLEKLPQWNQYILPYHRAVDISSMYFDPKHDSVVPSIEECLERAGIDGRVVNRALEDALLIAELVRAWK